MLEKEQMIFRNKKHFSSNGFDFVEKQRNQRKRQNRFGDDEKWLRSGDRPFSKAKRSNRIVFDQNELQTYVSLEKMLHKAIHAIRQLKKKENTNTSPAPKQQNNFSSLSNSDLKINVLWKEAHLEIMGLVDAINTEAVVSVKKKEGLHHVINEAGTDATKKSLLDKQQRARSTIILSVSDHVLRMIIKEKTVKGMFQVLDNLLHVKVSVE